MASPKPNQIESPEEANDVNISSPPDEAVFKICGLNIPLRGPAVNDHEEYFHPLPEDIESFRLEMGDSSVDIRCGITTTTVEKAALAARIPYFRAILTNQWLESKSGIDFSSILFDWTESIVETLFQYAQTGTLLITKDNAMELMRAAAFLSVEPLLDECARFQVKRLSPDNAIALLTFFKSPAIAFTKLNSEVLRFIDVNFVPISMTVDFINLPFDELETLLKRDSLRIDTEEQVFNAAHRWLTADPERGQHGTRLLACIRLPLLSASFVTEKVEKAEWLSSADVVGVARARVPSHQSTPRVCLDAPNRIVAIDICRREHKERVFDPFSNSWIHGKTSRLPSDLVGTVVWDGAKAYFVGRFELGGGHSFDPINNEWREIPSLKHDRSCEALGLIDGTIICAGGESEYGVALQSVIAFNTRAEFPRWKKINSMPTTALQAVTCVLNNRMYVIGGNNDDVEYSTGIVYNSSKKYGSWTSIAAMLGARSSCGAGVFRGAIIVAGGFRGGHRNVVAEVEAFNPEKNEWIKFKDMNRARRNPIVLDVSGRLIVLGGYTPDVHRAGNEVYVHMAEEYIQEIDEWKDFPEMEYGPLDKFITVLLPATLPVNLN